MRYLFLLLIFFIGCAETVQIKSDTTWTATVNQNVINGEGDMYINLPDDGVHVTVQKMTADGFIELRLNDGITGSESFMTRQPYGKIEMDL